MAFTAYKEHQKMKPENTISYSLIPTLSPDPDLPGTLPVTGGSLQHFGKPCQNVLLKQGHNVSLLLPVTGPGSTLGKKKRIPLKNYNPHKYLKTAITCTVFKCHPPNAD